MSTQDPVIDLMRLVSGFQVSQAISVFAELGIADVLKNDAQHIDAVAQATECYPRTLYRLLHMLASVGVTEELAGQHFKLAPLGECLRSDSPSKRSAWARYAGRPYVWQSWGAMLHSVKTGESSFSHLHGANLWEWRSKRRDETEIFDAAMSELSGAAGNAIASGYDFSVFNVIVDVGGGQGALLAAVLAQHKSSRGILFDLPHVVVKAQDVLRTTGVTDRCEIVGGDVFKAVPEGGDAYLIKSVLMDEDDDQAIGMQVGTAHAHFYLGRYDEAASMALQGNQDFQPGLRIAAASNAMAGRPEQARRAMARLRQLYPALRVSNLKDVRGPYQRAEDLSRLEEGLRQAGLPE